VPRSIRFTLARRFDLLARFKLLRGATDGAELSKGISIPHAALIIRKGFHKDVDSYSAFTEADGKTTTGLAAYLTAHQVKRLFVTGLATDFCVAWTALDARKASFETLCSGRM
jgi:nicotinamidase/pyrazinamidase